jgi:integrase
MGRSGKGWAITDLWAKKGAKTGKRWEARAWDPRQQDYRYKSFPDQLDDGSNGFAAAEEWAKKERSKLDLHLTSTAPAGFELLAAEYVRSLKEADRKPCDEHIEEIENVAERVVNAGIVDARAQDFALRIRAFISELRDAHPFRQPKEGEKDEEGNQKLPRPLSHATKFRYLGHLQSITRWATIWEHLDRDPLAKLKRTKPTGGRATFTIDEVARLVAPGPEDYWITIMSELYSGAEPGAGAHLRWEWCDWQGGLIWIREHPAYRLKRNRVRAVPMQPEWRQLIEERYPKKRPEIGWLQTNDAIRGAFGVKHLDRKKCVTLFRKYCADRDVTIGDRVPYSTRHTWVSIMLATTENPYDVMSWAGHESLKTTLTYGARRDDYRPAVKGWPRGTLKFLAAASGAAVAS